jgi:hypothetical protein
MDRLSKISAISLESHINKCSYSLIFYEKNEAILRGYKYLAYCLV